MEDSTGILNVTLLEPKLKHPTIFARFDALPEGEDFTIHNDHDPKPLYYQLLGERGNVFTWEYLEQGPEWWKVRIAKRRAGETDETLGQMAAADLRKAEVFKKFGLDFCCNGQKTLKEACKEKGLDVTKVEQELQQTDKKSTPAAALPYNEWDPGFLSDYIVNTHHRYLRKNLPEIRQYAAKVQEVHGSRHPELNLVREKVEAIHEELSAHLVKEERILFPYIKSLVAAKEGQAKFEQSPFGSVRNPVNMMEMEHQVVGEDLETLRNITAGYRLPDDACASYSLLYRLLAELEEDLHLHIHLENNILFPKALVLEKELATGKGI